jgi:polyphosphate kinase
LLPELIARIEREAAISRSGRKGRIRMKLNGLSDPDIVDALHRASNDGVSIELIVRGICTLRPGLPGFTENVRVISVLGRFLEHSRIIYFGNDGTPEYFIGSADMRPRNLRRRVELLAPVNADSCRRRIHHLLDQYVTDPTAWELTPSGDYVRRPGDGAGAQESSADEVTTAVR